MKLLLITSSAPFGKGESFVINEANAMASLGNNVVLVPTLLRKGSPNNFKLQKNVILLAKPIITFNLFTDFLFFSMNNPKYCYKLFCLASDKNIITSLKNYLVIPKSVWLAKYVEENYIDHIHAHWLTTSSTLAMLVAELTNIEWSVTAHRGDIVANNILEKKFEKAKFIRFISRSGKKLALERAKISDNKAKIIHMGVDTKQLTSILPSAKIKSTGLFNIICPANLLPVKGHDFLIDSISQMQLVNKIKLFIVGDGELRQTLEDKVKNLGLEKSIIFCGHIPHSELLSWYKTGDIKAVVLPSLDLGNGLHEGIPVSLMEAMAFNIPIISTRTGGIPELLEESDKKYGELIEANNTNELSRLLDNFVHSPEKNRKMVTLGYQRIMSKFNQIKSVSELLELMK